MLLLGEGRDKAIHVEYRILSRGGSSLKTCDFRATECAGVLLSGSVCDYYGLLLLMVPATFNIATAAAAS